jgi:hypothetical protein
VVPDDIAAFGDAVASRLESLLGDDLVGVWFIGSVAVGGYVPGESDVDVIAVSSRAIADDEKEPIVDRLLELTDDCPARGLELTLYRSEVVADPPRTADFELNANRGPRVPQSVHLDARSEPGFWYVLDRAIAHRYGVVITGPAAKSVFADAPRPTLLDAMAQSMRWHREHERATLYSVLNASRAWRYASDDVLGSKLDGAAWARGRWHQPELIDAAVALRHGRPADLHESDVATFLDHVEGVLVDTRRRDTTG